MPNLPVYIVIPSFNEQIEVLSHTITELLNYNPEYKIVVVDDGSEKDVRPYLHQPNITILRHKVNLGQGAALQTAACYLLGLEKELIVVHFDADGQHDVKSIPALIEPLQTNKFDITLGSRFLEGSTTSQMPALRKSLLKIARVVNGFLTGLWLTDAHNGFRALNLKALQKIRLTQNGFAHATELISLIKKHGLRYCEVPVSIRYTTYSLHKGQRATGALDIILDLFIKKLFK
jgi:glycosyltransferase involved in cell wall biosynthesis